MAEPKKEYFALPTGTKVLITVEATIVDVSTGHGPCYQVELPSKDFSAARKIWVDENEIKEIK